MAESIRNFFLTIQSSPWFARASTAVILMAAAVSGFETSRSLVQNYAVFFEALDAAILAFFVLEIIVRLGALGWNVSAFLRSPWNIFDLGIVILCLIPFESFNPAVIRMIRLLRVLRLLTALPQLRILIEALVKSLSSIFYVGVLLSLVFYIYAVLGTNFFAQKDPDHFANLGLSFLTLFQLVTLEGWVEILKVHRSAEGGYPPGVVLYFISFIMLGTMVVLNLLIGVIVNSMESVRQKMLEENHQAVPDRESINLSAERVFSELSEIRNRLRGIEERIRR